MAELKLATNRRIKISVTKVTCLFRSEFEINSVESVRLLSS